MATVTSVKTARSVTRVALDSGKDFVLSSRDLKLFPLAEGQEVSEDELRRFVLSRQIPLAFATAVRQLTRRICSRQEIVRKLTSASFEPEAIRHVMDKLEKEKWIDDQRFAEAWIHYRVGMHYGPERIRLELKMKGISEDLIRSAFAQADEESFEAQAVHEAEKLLRRCRGETPSFPELQKAAAALVRKGFEWEIARAAVSEAAARIKEHREPV